MVQYLEEHREGARFLGATYDLAVAALGFLESGEAFMALGGYRGSDPILTRDQFIQRVEAGEVRYFLTMSGGDSSPEQEEVRAWVESHCPAVELQSESVSVKGPCET